MAQLSTSEHPLNEIPDLVLDAAVSFFEPDLAFVYTRSKELGTYRASACFPPHLLSSSEMSHRFSVRAESRGTVGQAVRTRHIVVILDPDKAAANGDYVPFNDDAGTEIAIPIVAHDAFSFSEVVVAVVVLTRLRGRPFRSEEAALSHIAGTMIAAVFNRTIARERQDKRLDFLRELVGLTFDDLDQLFSSFLESLCKLTDARFASLWLRSRREAESDVLVLRSFFPRALDGERLAYHSFDRPVLRCDENLSGLSLAAKKPLLFDEPLSNPKFANAKFAKRHKLRWFVSCPVLGGDNEVTAVLNLWPEGTPADFSAAALQVLDTYVSPLATALRLSELLSEERELASFDALVDQLVRVEENPKSWDELASVIRDQIGCEGCSIFLEEGGSLKLRGTTGLEKSQPYSQVTYEPGEGLTGSTFLRNRNVIYYADLADEFAAVHRSKHREATRGKSKSIILSPIRARDDQAIGVIRCTNKRDGADARLGYFGPQEARQLEKIAGAVSILHSKAVWIREREKEWQGALLALHHELLNPVDTFVAQTNWIREHLSDIKRGREPDFERLALKCKDMEDSAVLAGVLVASLGRLDGDLRLHKAAQDLRKIVESSLAALRGEARLRGISIDTSAMASIHVDVDRRHMLRVIFNLIRNAIKYADTTEPHPEIRLGIRRNGDYCILSVQDNGIGIAHSERAVIFEKFVRGTNATDVFPEGTGLGLHYCQVICSAHGGVIRLRRLAKPTVFDVLLPLGD